ncbi:MAG: aldose 1-epimerase [Trueperella sp.]|nr:aldose 1-epimerase [Trueperella sp.]
MAENVVVTAEDFDGMPAWRLTSPSGATALVAQHGATLLSWEPKPGKNLIAGYQSAAELQAGTDGRSQFSAPWVGPIAGQTFPFQGKQLYVGAAAASGLAARADFTMAAADTRLGLRCELPDSAEYPWPVELMASFALETGADGLESLSVTFEVWNLAAEDAPIAVAWQPYLQLPGFARISNLAVHVPARTKILTDEPGVPLPGESAYAGVKAPFEMGYLGATQIDTIFRGLVPGENGVVTSWLADPASSVRVIISQEPAEAPVLRVSTADALGRAPRGAVGFAPMSHVPDAANRPDAAASLAVAPGGSRQMTATITYAE